MPHVAPRTPLDREYVSSRARAGFRKRTGEAAVRASGLPHVIVRSAAIDDVRAEEGLPVQSIADPDRADADALRASVAAGIEEAEGAVGVRPDEDAKKRRIHPRDLASYLVGCLSGDVAADSLSTASASSDEGGSDRAALEAQIRRVDEEKKAAVVAQDFVRAGELLEEANRLKGLLDAPAEASTSTDRADAQASDGSPSSVGAPSMTSSTVEVWTTERTGLFA